MRIYLTGALSVQHAGTLLPQRAFPGVQGRIVFAMLAAEHGTPLSRDQLVEELWNGSPPAGPEVAVRALVSKLRGLLALLAPAADTAKDQAAGVASTTADQARNVADEARATYDAMVAAMKDHVLASGEVIGLGQVAPPAGSHE